MRLRPPEDMAELVMMRLAAPRTKSWALFEKGFRPFFLLACLAAITLVPTWLAHLSGALSLGTYLAPTYWHAHEMVFGFALAVIAGFLLTAASNWTQRETARGAALAALAALWLAGRMAMLAAAAVPAWLVAAVNLAFLPALGLAVGRAIVGAGNRRNLPLLAVLGLLWGAQLAVHLDGLGVLPGAQRIGTIAGVDLIVVLMVIISGRVVPMFTRNATGAEIAGQPWLERGSVAAVVLVAVTNVLGAPPEMVAVASAVAALALVARARHWGTRHTLRDPLLWVLHAGCAFIPLGLALRTASTLSPAIPASMALHALTAGAMGTLTLGMMARVTLGHTGRLLRADRLLTAAFALAVLGGLARAGGALLPPAAYLPALHVAGTAWTLAFLLLGIRIAPMLLRPRVDGKPG